MSSQSGPSGDVGKFHRLHSGKSREYRTLLGRLARKLPSRSRSSLKWSCQLAPVAIRSPGRSREASLWGRSSGCTINVLISWFLAPPLRVVVGGGCCSERVEK
ncbi:hypothetical protein RRG08_017453 [Elysia crispata]|uniref:Uncharacterized protein n=1 Tax=Elysia crispata TaxID=231223 RepID=A0AAE1DE76_9GAST|nr:hypothetical protein RRG08_017453 [Elysia crispata]